MNRLRLILVSLLLPVAGAAQAPTVAPFVPGTTTVFSADFSAAGALPPNVRFTKGTPAWGQQGGLSMLKASGPTEFIISFPDVLPQQFTIEADLFTSSNAAEIEFAVQGTIGMTGTTRSALLAWHHAYTAVFRGGAAAGDKYYYPTPDLLPELRNQVAHIQIVMDGRHLTYFTNDEVIADVADLVFRRDKFLLVYLGGSAIPNGEVYLAKLRIGSNSGAAATVAVTPPASQGALAAPGGPVTPASPTPGTVAGTPTNAPPVPIAVLSVSPQTGTITPMAPAAPPPPPQAQSPLNSSVPLIGNPRGKPAGVLTTIGTGPAPANLAVTGTPTTATVTWSPVPGAVGYLVNRAPVGTTAWTAVTPAQVTATTGPADLLPDRTKTYTYQVQAYQANGNFGSAVVDFTAPKPTDPAKLKAMLTAPSGITLTWNAAPYAAKYLVGGPGMPVDGQTSATSFELLSAPSGTNTYRVASVFDPGGVLTPASAWSAVTIVVPPRPAVPMLTLPNGAGSLAEYNLHACSSGKWVAAEQVWPNDWCDLPGPNSVANVQILPFLTVFGIQELVTDWVSGKDIESIKPADKWTVYGVWPWLQSEKRVPEAEFVDRGDLMRNRKVGCVKRGAGAGASTMCWADTHSDIYPLFGSGDPAGVTFPMERPRPSLSLIVQEASGSHFFVFTRSLVTTSSGSGSPSYSSRGTKSNQTPIMVAATTADLDSRGNQPVPHACIACHGGRFDPKTGSVIGSSLLPLDPRGFSFESHPSRADQEETIRQLNLAVFTASSAAGVREYINRMYRGQQSAIGATVDDAYVPTSWTDQPGLYRTIYRPYCASCHSAQAGPLGFLSWGDLVREKIRVKNAICQGTMPHAEVPFWRLWTEGGAVSYPGVLLAALGYSGC